jgi:histidine ammonia-lyase
MAVVLEDRADITLEAFRRVAWEGEAVELAPVAVERIADARAAFMALLDDPAITIYGVTSGYGDRASVRLDPDERRTQARRGPRGLSVSFGDPLPERVVRGIVLARLASFVGGHAAVRPVLAEAVAAMLDGRSLPAIPSQGNGGSGEIIALGRLFAGFADLGLEEKESLALVNGSPCSSALLADAALSARRRLELAEEVLALSAEAVRAPHEAYAEELDGLWGDEHEAAALARFRALLGDAEGQRRPYQAPVSFRIAPRVLGQTHRAVAAAERSAAISLGAVSDNPVFVPPRDGKPARILSNGSYHNAQAPAALDGLAAAWADVARLAERQLEHVVRDPSWTDDHRPGELYALLMVQAAYAADADAAARRTPLVATGAAQNDVSSPSFVAWRSERDTARSLLSALAVLAAAAARSLASSERQPPPALATLLDQVDAHLPPAGEMHGDQLEALTRAFEARAIPVREAVESPHDA